MLIQKIKARFRQGATLAALVAAAGCQDQESSSLLEPVDVASGDAILSLHVSSFTATEGQRVTVAIRAAAPVAIGGVDGYLRFNATRLRYAGQIPEANTPVVINAGLAEQGQLRVVSVNTEGFAGKNVALVTFDVLGTDYPTGISFEANTVASLALSELRFRSDRQVGLLSSLPNGSAGTMLSENEWFGFLEPGVVDGPRRAPGSANIWGDSNNNGSINTLDVLHTASLNAGLRQCILLPEGPANDCVTANVNPTNLPGLGEPTDSCAPGIEDCAGAKSKRSINVLDVLAVAQDNAGNPDHPVVGAAVPKAPAITAGDTANIVPKGSGNDTILTGVIHLTNDKLWIVNRVLRFGNEAVPGDSARLIVDPGTRIEGLDSTAILITRNARIYAEGTYSQPITFTCVDDFSTPGTSPGVRAPGCWGGMYIAGNARLNEGSTGAPVSPSIPGRNGGGALSRAAEGWDPADVYYGGDNDADSSGRLRFVRFLFGGFTVAANNELNNLTLGACGSGTVLEYIQVHGGSDDGMELFGGRCDVKYLLATENDDDQFDYSFGYDGDVQFLIAQTALSTRFLAETETGFEVDNTETAATYKAGGPGGIPGRTFAHVWNVTMVQGDNSGDVRSKAYNIRRGAGSFLGNHLILNAATVFDIDEVASCDALPGGIDYAPPAFQLDWGRTLVLSGNLGSQVEHSSGHCAAGLATWLGNSLTSASAASVLSAYPGTHSGGIEMRAYANELRGPWDRARPDFRPSVSGLGFAGATPPAGFDTSADYIGALDDDGSIPWYLGWNYTGL